MKEESREGELTHNKLERKMRCTIKNLRNEEVNNMSHVPCNNMVFLSSWYEFKVTLKRFTVEVEQLHH